MSTRSKSQLRRPSQNKIPNGHRSPKAIGYAEAVRFPNPNPNPNPTPNPIPLSAPGSPVDAKTRPGLGSSSTAQGKAKLIPGRYTFGAASTSNANPTSKSAPLKRTGAQGKAKIYKKPEGSV